MEILEALTRQLKILRYILILVIQRSKEIRKEKQGELNLLLLRQRYLKNKLQLGDYSYLALESSRHLCFRIICSIHMAHNTIEVPPYATCFFAMIRKVHLETPLNVRKMSEKEWYRVLLEEYCTMEIDQTGQ